jgi:nucleotide-binding universal stress UspA family protein
MQPTVEAQLEGDMYKNVLIGLNDSQAAERALHRAIAMAKIEKGDLFVVVVNEGVPIFDSIVWAVLGNYFKELEDDQRDLSRRLLDDAQKQAQGHSIHRIRPLRKVNRSIAFWKPFTRYKQTSLSSGSLRTSGLEA